jgi:hypothetical protein
MSRRWNDKLAAVIRLLLRDGSRGRETQSHQEEPMKNESMTLTVDDTYTTTTVAYKEVNTSLAPIETVGRSLGYTEKQLSLAGDALNRFA